MESDDSSVTGESGDGYVLQTFWFQPVVAPGRLDRLVRRMGHHQCPPPGSGISGATGLCQKKKGCPGSGSRGAWRTSLI